MDLQRGWSFYTQKDVFDSPDTLDYASACSTKVLARQRKVFKPQCPLNPSRVSLESSFPGQSFELLR
jgi:hypothetical protein